VISGFNWFALFAIFSKFTPQVESKFANLTSMGSEKNFYGWRLDSSFSSKLYL